MGADRRGPLAAFIVVAIIAAILLVTSVRSRAEAPDTRTGGAATIASPYAHGPWTSGVRLPG